MKLIGTSVKFQRVLEFIDRVACTTAPVLVCGETGTGKELTARAIHYSSDRRDHPFIPINCGAIPDNLVESELFGHVEGAFTGAKHAHAGLLSEADGGTVFLDELEALSPKAQVVLLRFLEDQSYRPVGHTRHKAVDTRILSAVNIDLLAAVTAGTFRSDLLYRLAVVSLVLPPLRERDGDRHMLADLFLRECAAQYERPARPLHGTVREMIDRYDWPGNVRELRNFIHAAFVMSTGPTIEMPPTGIVGPRLDVSKPNASLADAPLSVAKAQVTAEFERTYIVQMLKKTAGNISHAAKLSGKDRRSFGRLMKTHGVDAATLRSLVRG
jgi:two-component system, NtrC family, response regulator GlrR